MCPDNLVSNKQVLKRNEPLLPHTCCFPHSLSGKSAKTRCLPINEESKLIFVLRKESRELGFTVAVLRLCWNSGNGVVLFVQVVGLFLPGRYCFVSLKAASRALRLNNCNLAFIRHLFDEVCSNGVTHKFRAFSQPIKVK